MAMFQWQRSSRPKSGRSFKGPVSWLLGRQLIAGLKWIAIYTFFGDKLDARDWMRAEINDRHEDTSENGAFWFDYLSDSGDGQCATYNIAYLCMHDLWLPSANSAPDINKEAKKVSLIESTENSFKLPRGEFLFVGGDTAYHIADYTTLAERFQRPFNWAYEDIFGQEVIPEQRRPIYGIPGNHDYYDALDGFNRQFLKPFNRENFNETRGSGPQLSLKGFKRFQQASYVALKLPYGWWIWGLDAQEGMIDLRQEAFFLSICNPEFSEATAGVELERRVPDKLIVATPVPSTKFGMWTKKDEDIAKTFKKLGLEPSFIKSKKGKLLNSQCRLDIAGDIHHYARYWGKGAADNPEYIRSNYASVVAGGGGAFLHPSHTNFEEVTESQLYPSRKDSHQLITKRLLMPWNIFQGGYVWLAGAIVTLMTYFAAAIPESSWSVFKLIPNELRPLHQGGNSLLSRIQEALATKQANLTNDYYWDLAYAIGLLTLLIASAIRIRTFFEAAINSSPEIWIRSRYQFTGFHLVLFAPIGFFIYWGPHGSPHSFLASLLVFLFLAASLTSFVISRRYNNLLFERAKSHKVTKWDYTPLWILMLFAVVSTCYGLWHYGMYSVSVVLSDTLTILILLLIIGGLILYAVVVGGELQDKIGKLRFAALGGWHGVLQISVPFLLVAYSSWTTMIVIVAGIILATLLIGRIITRDFIDAENLLHQHKLGQLLLFLWLVVGVLAMIAASWGAPLEITWGRLAAAFLLGGVLSCVWFGWYLAVALAFNGHNNEAGGGARSDNYRHFIRFRLTPKNLTGYVIGIDQPIESFQEKKDSLRLRLIDVFTIGL
jgi:hypothetical protein